MKDPFLFFPLLVFMPYSFSIYICIVALRERRKEFIGTELQVEKMEEQVETVGRAFVNHYYNLFDNDRSSLANLYQPDSMLSFEGQKILGVDDISNKLNNLPFDQCKHVVSTIDSQPSSFAGGIVVFVSGSLYLPGEDHPLRFSQMFHLIPAPEGGLFVQNDMFRLNYG